MVALQHCRLRMYHQSLFHIHVQHCVSDEEGLYVNCMHANVRVLETTDVCCSDLSEPSGSDAADELMEDVDGDSDVELVTEREPTPAGQVTGVLASIVVCMNAHRSLSVPITLKATHELPVVMVCVLLGWCHGTLEATCGCCVTMSVRTQLAISFDISGSGML